MINFEKAKKLDKQGLDYLKRYLYSKYTRLDECYASYSTSKQVAYNANINLMRDLGGQDFKILSYNCNFFTVAFLVKKDNDFYLFVNTGRKVYLYKFLDIEIIFKIGSFAYFDRFSKLIKGGC